MSVDFVDDPLDDLDTEEQRPGTESPEVVRDRIKRALKAKRRLAAVEHAALLDVAHNVPTLNRAARVTARALRAPVVQINLLTESMLVPVAAFCAAGEAREPWTEPRRAGHSLCKFVLAHRGPLAITDARVDPLVMNTYAAAQLDVGAYLGAPLRANPEKGKGPIIGTVCAVDHASRAWTPDEIEAIADIADGLSEFIDIRAQQHLAMRSAEPQLARILQHVAVGVICTDSAGVTTFANAKAESLLGFSAAELVGHDQHALIHHSRADGSRFPEVECHHYLARQAGRVSVEENDTFWRADGTSLAASTTMTPIMERGEVIGSVLTFTDATSRRAAEAVSAAKNELLRLVAKELEGPIDADALRTLAGLLAS